MGKPESCELDANSLKSGRAGQGTGQGNSCELDAKQMRPRSAAPIRSNLIRANLQMTGRGSSPRCLVMSEPRLLPDPFGQPVDGL